MPNADADAGVTLTIVAPPAHAIPELTVPTGVHPSSGDHSATVTQQSPVLPLLKRLRRPPSQHIAEVFDEISDGPSSASHHRPHSTKTTANTT